MRHKTRNGNPCFMETSEASPIISLAYNLGETPVISQRGGAKLVVMHSLIWEDAVESLEDEGNKCLQDRIVERRGWQGVCLITADGWENYLNLGQKHHHHMNILEGTVLGDYKGPRIVSVLTNKTRKFHHLQATG